MKDQELEAASGWQSALEEQRNSQLEDKISLLEKENCVAAERIIKAKEKCELEALLLETRRGPRKDAWDQ